MISKNLIKSSFIYTIIGALPLASAFFLLLFYTNYITKADYGAFVLYISFTLFVQILVNFGLDTYIGISYFEHKHDPDLLKVRIGNIVAYLLAVGIISCLVFLLLGKPLFSFIFKGKDLFFFPYGFMSVITAFFNSFFKTYSNLLINQQRPERFATVNFANFIMTIGFSLGGLFLYPYTLIGPMWGRLLSGFGIFLIALFAFTHEYPIRLQLGTALRKTISFSLPVLVFFLLSWVISNIFPWIMKQFMSLDEIAVFGLALQFTLLIEFTLNGLSSAFMPKVYELIKKDNLYHSTPELNKYFSAFNALSLLIIPLATFLLPLIMPIFIPKDYSETYLFLALLNISFASRGLYNYFLAPIYYHKKTSLLPKLYSYTAIIQIVASIILIKYYGIWGAVWANLFTKIIQNIFLYTGSRKFFRFEFNTLKLLWLPLLVTAFIIITEFVAKNMNIHLIHLIQLVITSTLVFLVYKKETYQLALSLLKTRKDS
ncbi:MAG TPA: polysaccharide biosynthesis C-terminal domain-containing protein [Bacteroidales bacterium]|jgi:O-antigen/teichoic acid export membrane protein|nr:polysaccharide biosynthesis C-terminal domain-containing protein [Bacteroidales bacterium]